MTRVLVVASVLVVGAAAFLASCRDEPPVVTPPVVTASTAGVRVGTVAPPVKPTPEEAMEAYVKLRDETARGLIESAKTRMFDPRRDANLEHLKGQISIRDGELEAVYRFEFDTKNSVHDPVTFEVVSEPKGLAAGTAAKAKLWAIQSTVGAWGIVIFYRPPVRLRLQPATDKLPGHLVVVAPSHHSPLNVSYAFDERQVVTGRGEWTDEKHKAVTSYEWELSYGRYLMRKETVFEGPRLEFDYDKTDGVILIRRVHMRDGVRAVEATLTYDDIRVGAK